MKDLGVDMCGSFDQMQNLEVRTLQSESMGSQSVAKHEEPTLNNVITCLYGTASLTSSDILHIIDMHLYRYTFHGGTCSFHVFAHSLSRFQIGNLASDPILNAIG